MIKRDKNSFLQVTTIKIDPRPKDNIFIIYVKIDNFNTPQCDDYNFKKIILIFATRVVFR